MRLLTRAEAITLGLTVVCGSIMLWQDINGSLDVTYFYTGEEARAYLRSLSPDETSRYLTKEYFDLGYMTGYSTFAYLLLKRFRGISSLAVVPWALDMVETLTLISLLRSQFYDFELDWLGIVSCLKWTSAGLVVSYILFLIARSRVSKV